jgi:hypothetical protein
MELIARAWSIATMIGALGTLAAVTGCAATPAADARDALGVPLRQPVTQRELGALPLASLVYPGSSVVQKVGSDERAQPGEREPDPAYAGVIATTAAPPDVLLAWYANTLDQRGYRPSTYYLLAGQADGRAWNVPGTRDQLQVAVLRGTDAHAAATSGGSSSLVTYEAIVVDYHVTGPPPS